MNIKSNKNYHAKTIFPCNKGLLVIEYKVDSKGFIYQENTEIDWTTFEGSQGDGYLLEILRDWKKIEENFDKVRFDKETITDPTKFFSQKKTT